jgi:hypothetical protein
MKMRNLIAIYLLFFSSFIFVKAQNNDALNYLIKIVNTEIEINDKYLNYNGAIAHGKSARKVENKRGALIQSVNSAKNIIASMPCYESDCALRDSLVSFLSMQFYVLNYDFAKILNMEDVAEQSYDNMELFMNAQTMANDKVENAGKIVDKVFKEFAKNHNVPLSNKKDEMTKKIEKVSAVNKHYEAVYLIFFKAYKQEAYMMDAINRRDYSAAGQNKDALLSISIEGLSKLDTLKAFMNDKSLITACHRSLEFYKSEAKDKIGIVIDYLMKAEEGDKLQRTVGSTDPMRLTNEERAQFNKVKKELDLLTRSFNTTNPALNQARTVSLNNWNGVVKSYMERYIPKGD